MNATPAPGAPPLDWPYYGIGPVAAFKRVFQKYATFSGRASRGEYWWWWLLHGVVAVVLGIVLLAAGIDWESAGAGAAEGGINAFGIVVLIILAIWGLATIIPSIAVTVRRLHDAGFSGWFYLLTLVGPLGFVVFVMCIIPTSPNAVRYGPPGPEGALPGYPPNPQAYPPNPQAYPQGLQGYPQPPQGGPQPPQA